MTVIVSYSHSIVVAFVSPNTYIHTGFTHLSILINYSINNIIPIIERRYTVVSFVYISVMKILRESTQN